MESLEIFQFFMLLNRDMYRKGIACIIINSNMKIMLINLMSFEYQYFSLPGGGIDNGETKIDALKRELFEELGLEDNKYIIIKESAKPVKFKFSLGSRIMDGKKYIGQEKSYFLVKFIGKDYDIKRKEDEVRKYIWSNYKELHKHLLFDGQLKDTEKLISELCPDITP